VVQGVSRFLGELEKQPQAGGVRSFKPFGARYKSSGHRSAISDEEAGWDLGKQRGSSYTRDHGRRVRETTRRSGPEGGFQVVGTG
jgi:hypothetical protein